MVAHPVVRDSGPVGQRGNHGTHGTHGTHGNSALCGVETSLRQLADAGLRCSVTDRAFTPWGPVLTERLPWLRARGLMDADADAEEEELVIIRAERV